MFIDQIFLAGGRVLTVHVVLAVLTVCLTIAQELLLDNFCFGGRDQKRRICSCFNACIQMNGNVNAHVCALCWALICNKRDVHPQC